jgi:hypothetical protein
MQQGPQADQRRKQHQPNHLIAAKAPLLARAARTCLLLLRKSLNVGLNHGRLSAYLIARGISSIASCKEFRSLNGMGDLRCAQVAKSATAAGTNADHWLFGFDSFCDLSSVTERRSFASAFK